jgi:radical SAM family uncharacterized protein/radical SAM-linked protein
MSLFEQNWFSNISRPSRYLGGEINAVRKNPAETEVSIALAFPDLYEVGMSHLGLKILYHLLNREDWIAAERVFCPAIDLETELRRRKTPLSTLESHRPLEEFDILGFSLQHELSYSNVLNMLDLAGVSLLASERKDTEPLIIAGGPACFNPEPMADFIDLFVIGDGEHVALEICRAVREAKRGRIIDKRALLSHLRHVRGVYVPSFFHIRHSPEGPVAAIEPLTADYPYVEKAILEDMNDAPFPERQVVPFTELVHDRLAIEVARGCTRGCRFCQAGMIYRPVREREPESILEHAERALASTGYEDLSLLSLSTGDYSCVGPLLRALMDRRTRDRVAVSLPSLRVDSLDAVWIDQIKRVRKTGFTLAVEAGNDQLRKVINKGLTQDDILNMAKAVYGAGWNLIKLYFMVGLPSEEEQDIRDIIILARQIATVAGGLGRKTKLNVSIATFVPKSHTPFQWLPQLALTESRRRIEVVQEALKGSRIRVKWNQPELSWLEGVFSRGDRRLGRVLLQAWRLGAKFDAWTEHYHMDLWKEAFKLSGVDPHFYLHRERSSDEVLPWDHIRSGVTKSFLNQELERAMAYQETPDCRQKCHECGVCDHKDIHPVFCKGSAISLTAGIPPETPGAALSRKYRLTFNKTGSARFLSHLELARVFVRALKRAGLSLIYTQGFHPLPRLSFASALPVGTQSLNETAEVELAEILDGFTLQGKINSQLPAGIQVTRVEGIPRSQKKPWVKESHFVITVKEKVLDQARLETFLNADHFPLLKTGKKGKREVDARSLVMAMSLTSSNTVELAVRHTRGPELKPAEIVRGVFQLEPSDNGFEVLKVKQVLD